MKTAVITGSSRGLGFEMAKCFRKCGMNVVLNGVSLDRLQKARHALESIPGNGKETIDLPEKTKKFYNIVGDHPDVVADYLVTEILKNTKNNIHIQWLTPRKVMWRFMTAGFNKRDFFA